MSSAECIARVLQVTDPIEKSRICDEILHSIPSWFGIEESIQEYMREVQACRFLSAVDTQTGEAIGFTAMKAHNAYTDEIAVMGIREPYHRKGIGRRMMEDCIKEARRLGKHFLTVKTLAELSPDPGYARTRKFYEAIGFMPLEVFPTLWGEENPCLFMAMSLQENPIQAFRA